MIRVTFSYSPSQTYETVVNIAQAADEYTCSGEGRHVTHEARYHFENFPKAKKLILLVKGWKTAGLSSCGAELELQKFYRLESIYLCWSQAVGSRDPEPYCSQTEGRIRRPIDHLQQSLLICRLCKIVHRGFRWDAYGFLAPDGMFVIDKQRLRELAERDREYKRPNLCPLFDWSKIETAISELPDRVALEVITPKRVPDIIVSPVGIERTYLNEETPDNVVDFLSFRNESRNR